MNIRLFSQTFSVLCASFSIIGGVAFGRVAMVAAQETAKPECPAIIEIACPFGNKIDLVTGCKLGECLTEPTGLTKPAICPLHPISADCKEVGKNHDGCPIYECPNMSVPPPPTNGFVPAPRPNCGASDAECGAFCAKLDHAKECGMYCGSSKEAHEECARWGRAHGAVTILPPKEFPMPPTGAPGEMPKPEMMPRPEGVHLGGGLFGTGPGGCTSPEECKEYCLKFEHKNECDKFFRSFRSGKPEFEEHRVFVPKEDFEKERKHAEEQSLRQIKEGLRHMTRMINEMKARFRRLEAKKVTIPADLKDALAKLEELKKQALAATSPEEMMELGPQMQELVEFINEHFGDLERLSEFPRILRDVERMLRQFETQYRRLETRAKVRKLDVAEALGEVRAMLDAMKKARDEAKAKADSGQAEEAFELLQTEVFERSDEVREKMFALELIIQAPARIAQKTREIRQLESRIRQLERRGFDMSDAKQLLEEAKGVLAKIKDLVKVKPLPIEELMENVESLEDLLDQVRDHLGEEEVQMFRPFELGLPPGLPVAPSTPSVETPTP